MQDTVSYAIRLGGLNYKLFEDTIRVYRDAVSYLIPVCLKTYKDWKDLSNHSAQRYITVLVHSTKERAAKFKEFDKKFVKFPSELRKDAIDKALGIVRSYRSQLANWEADGRIGKQPILNHTQVVMPCLFNRDMFKRTDDLSCQIKLYIQHDWVWKELHLRKTDVQYIKKHCRNLSESAPALEKRMHKMYLRFSYDVTYGLPDVEDSDSKKYVIPDTICPVDLGVNTDATCCIMHRDGTVTARKFINSPVEKDRMYGILDAIRDSQRNGNFHNFRLWRFVDNYNTAIAIITAREIVEFAKAHGATVIVMENLRISGRIRGSKKQRLHLWRKREILHRVEAMAHRNGMRVRTVCAWNTSRLAFDGSGRVKRGKESGWTANNYSICEFPCAGGMPHGKIYNCDLNASYNIGARYFTKVIIKSIPVTEWCALRAKVPEAFKRTESEGNTASPAVSTVRVTLSTLISLNRVLASSEVSTQLSAVSVEGKTVARKGQTAA